MQRVTHELEAFCSLHTHLVGNKSERFPVVTSAWMLVAGGDGCIRLAPEPQGLPQAVRRKFPHLASLPVLRLPADAAAQGALAAVLRAQCAVVASRGSTLAAATGAALLEQMSWLRPPCTALPHGGVVARAAAASRPTPRMWPSLRAQCSIMIGL